MSIGRNALYLQSSKIGQILLAFAASVILARTLGLRGSGIYAGVLAFAVLTQGIASLGFEDLVLARGPLLGGDSRAARRLYSATLRLRLVVVYGYLVAGDAVLFLVRRDPFGSGATMTLACALFYAGLNSLATLGAAVQAARLRAGSTAALDMCWSAIVTASYAAMAITGTLSVESALVATAAGQFVVDLGYIGVLFPLLRLTSGERRRVSEQFKLQESVVFWINGLLSIGVGKTSDVLAMRTAGATTSLTGLYNAAFNAYQTASQALLQGVGTIAYVGLGRTFSLRHPARTAAAWRTTVVVAILASVPPLTVTTVFASRILRLLFGEAFSAGANGLIVLSLCGLASRVIGGGSNQAMLFLGEKQRTVLAVRGIVVTVNVALDFVLFRLFGVVGVAWASGLSGVLIAYIEFALSRRLAPIRIPLATAVLIFAPYLISSLLVKWLLWNSSDVATLVGGCASVILGTVMLIVVRPLRGADAFSGDRAQAGRVGKLLQVISHASA